MIIMRDRTRGSAGGVVAGAPCFAATTTMFVSFVTCSERSTRLNATKSTQSISYKFNVHVFMGVYNKTDNFVVYF
jgi:hypothetical protein